jgi:disulfide bond formation protein DsbB
VESLAPWLFQVTATCADAAVDLFGVPYEYWSLAVFVALGVGAIRVLSMRR